MFLSDDVRYYCQPPLDLSRKTSKNFLFCGFIHQFLVFNGVPELRYFSYGNAPFFLEVHFFGLNYFRISFEYTFNIQDAHCYVIDI